MQQDLDRYVVYLAVERNLSAYTVRNYRTVAEGRKNVVEADAAARQELITWQREVQAEGTHVGRQRDLLEEERRMLAAQRKTAPIVAAAITDTALLLGCLLPLVVCWYLLRRPADGDSQGTVIETLLDELSSGGPLLLPPGNRDRLSGPHRTQDAEDSNSP